MIRTLALVFAINVAATADGVEFASDFRDTPDRIWIGADFELTSN